MLLFLLASCSVAIRSAYQLLVERRIIPDIMSNVEEIEDLVSYTFQAHNIVVGPSSLEPKYLESDWLGNQFIRINSNKLKNEREGGETSKKEIPFSSDKLQKTDTMMVRSILIL